MVEWVLRGYVDTDQLRLLAGRDSLNMTRLALHLSGFVNGVADRHARTTTRMFPGYKIRAITNGVHLPTWTHPAFAELFNRHYPAWAHEPEALAHADQLDDSLVWKAHTKAKSDLADFVERNLGMRLDPNLPLLGFARRMTAYKRPDLLLSDIDRLKTVAAKYPFQLVMAGKAHPSDGAGKSLIRLIHQKLSELAPEVTAVFLPNYDMAIAKVLVPGVDVWLNTPEPPLEASGTSGMKAAANGVLNLSVLDGWWLEACVDGTTGWAIGTDGTSGAAQASASDLYDKLERQVLPLYNSDRARWIFMMKEGISKIACYFNTHRMMRRYAAEAYLR
jgi:starch phosphorylase